MDHAERTVILSQDNKKGKTYLLSLYFIFPQAKSNLFFVGAASDFQNNEPQLNSQRFTNGSVIQDFKISSNPFNRLGEMANEGK